MKRINKISIISSAVALLLIGCGGGGGSTNPSSSTTYDVTVERGAVYEATVTDASGQTATQKANKNGNHSAPNIT